MEKDHGRLEWRTVTVTITTNLDFLSNRGDWKDVKTIVQDHCKWTVKNAATGEYETSEFDRYYISSLSANAQ